MAVSVLQNIYKYTHDLVSSNHYAQPQESGWQIIDTACTKFGVSYGLCLLKRKNQLCSFNCQG